MKNKFNLLLGTILTAGIIGLSATSCGEVNNPDVPNIPSNPDGDKDPTPDKPGDDEDETNPDKPNNPDKPGEGETNPETPEDNTKPNVPETLKTSTILEAREIKQGTKVQVEGVVSKLLYTEGNKPSGFILIDKTGSILVSNIKAGKDLNTTFVNPEALKGVSEGNKVTVTGTRDDFLRKSNNKLGNPGSIQITDFKVTKNDNGNNKFLKDSIETKSIKDVIDEGFSLKNPTNIVYKTKAYIDYKDGSSWTNYYLVDGSNSDYKLSVYSQNNGQDYAYLNDYVGELKDVYYTILDYKYDNSNLIPRCAPIAIEDLTLNGLTENQIPNYLMEKEVMPQFKPGYELNPSLELVTSITIPELNNAKASVTYSSDNELVATIDTIENKTVLNIHDWGEATITSKVTYKTHTSTRDYKIESWVLNENKATRFSNIKELIDAPYFEDPEFDKMSVFEGTIIASADNSIYTARKTIYVGDETGVILVDLPTNDTNSYRLGDVIKVEGWKVKIGGNDKGIFGTTVVDANTIVLSSKVNENPFDETSYITNKTLADVVNLAKDASIDQTTKVFKVKAKLELKTLEANIDENTNVSLNVFVKDPGQTSWCKSAYEITYDIALVNLDKQNNYSAFVLAAYYDDGTIARNIKNLTL